MNHSKFSSRPTYLLTVLAQKGTPYWLCHWFYILFIFFFELCLGVSMSHHPHVFFPLFINFGSIMFFQVFSSCLNLIWYYFPVFLETRYNINKFPLELQEHFFLNTHGLFKIQLWYSVVLGVLSVFENPKNVLLLSCLFRGENMFDKILLKLVFKISGYMIHDRFADLYTWKLISHGRAVHFCFWCTAPFNSLNQWLFRTAR